MKPQLISSQPISTEGAFLTKLQQDYVMPLHGLFEQLCQGYVPVYDLLLGLKLGLLPHISHPLAAPLASHPTERLVMNSHMTCLTGNQQHVGPQ